MGVGLISIVLNWAAKEGIMLAKRKGLPIPQLIEEFGPGLLALSATVLGSELARNEPT